MQDLAFEAMCEVCGIDWQTGITDNERGRVNKALGDLRSIYGEIATLPMMIHERASAYKEMYPEMPCTPQALTGNWSTILNAVEARREQMKVKASEQRHETNAHAKRGCTTCGDDHIVSVGYDADGYELTAPCPDCGPRTDATYWTQRRKIEPMDPAKTREMLGESPF